jgi:hypothetical protein
MDGTLNKTTASDSIYSVPINYKDYKNKEELNKLFHHHKKLIVNYLIPIDLLI